MGQVGTAHFYVWKILKSSDTTLLCWVVGKLLVRIFVIPQSTKSSVFFHSSAHTAAFEFSLIAHMLEMLLGSKIAPHISLNFCQVHQDGRLVIKALIVIQFQVVWVIMLVPW